MINHRPPSWPYQSVLIANRGEVVARIARTARRLGLRTVAVYCDADAAMPYLQRVDQSVRIDSYLDAQAIIAAARAGGADAIHPGYGFLAESDAFAQQVLDAGLTWIGPTPASMRAVGNKANARRGLLGTAVPVLPGYDGAGQCDAALIAAAESIGMPVMVKAAHGGGGRGMRLVLEAADLPAALTRARSEAVQAFGCGDLLLERALVAPRHIEVQVFGDAAGALVHMGERDCSVQRRHQKLIEESPSPAVGPDLRAQMTAAALAVASSCTYVGAGTVEFLLDQNGEFWFIEMNTRLQVEHPVTEAVTGLDLVEWQLSIAAGEALPLDQGEIDARLAAGGHAIEVRLCAEDPLRDFTPQSGRIGLWRRPVGLRCEDTLESGQVVSPFYDSMLAKLIGHGANRELARQALVAGLRDTVLLGIATNQDFLLDAVQHKAFVDGAATTAFVDGATRDEPAALEAAIAAALILAHRSVAGAGYPPLLAGWSNSAALALPLRMDIDGVSFALNVTMAGPNCWQLESGGAIIALQIDAFSATGLLFQLDGRTHSLAFHATREQLQLRHGEANHTVRDRSFLSSVSRTAVSDGSLRAPMNGRVVAIHAVQGQSVVAGQALLVIDAMKMEHSVLAPIAGVVRIIHITDGLQVAPGMLLMEIAPMEKAQ